jgi:microcystin-dependent protein
MADEYILKSYDGGAERTTLTASFDVGGSTLSVANGSTFPDGSIGPFVVVVDRGLSAEEKFLIDTTSGTNGVIFNIQQAGYDGTSTSNHAPGATVEHCIDAYSIEQANRYVNLQQAKGDLVGHNGTTPVRFTLGGNTSVLMADSAQGAGVKWGQIVSSSIENGSITNAKIDTGAITESKIADGAITASKIAEGAIVLPASVPTGVVNAFAGSAANAPTGWLICDGTAVSRSTYSALFTLIGTTYGAGNGSTTFNLPNLQNRFVAGRGSLSWSDTLNETGGSKDAVVASHGHNTVGHGHSMSHSHGASMSSSGGHSHNGRFLTTATGSGSNADLMRPWALSHTNTQSAVEPGSGAHSHTTTIGEASTSVTGVNSETVLTAGVDGTNANLPPFITLNYIIKT